MAREFKDAIFMGNGDRSRAEHNRLKERLDEGISLLSGLQQPCMSTDETPPEQDKAEREKAEQELWGVARDIVAALLGADARVSPVSDEWTRLEIQKAMNFGRLRIDGDAEPVFWDAGERNTVGWLDFQWDELTKEQQAYAIRVWRSFPQAERERLTVPLEDKDA